MRPTTILVSSACVSLILAFGACGGVKKNLTEDGPSTGGQGGAPPTSVDEACAFMCQVAIDKGCGPANCADYPCPYQQYATYAPWCRSAIETLATCVMTLPDLQFACANGIAIVDEMHFEMPCAQEILAMELCIWEGPQGGITADLAAACQARCDLFAGLSCAPADCLGECATALADASECNAIAASFLLCALEHSPTARCVPGTGPMGMMVIEAVIESMGCDPVGEQKFDCEFQF